MAKAKRANHRSGTERPRWTPNGTVEEPGADEADWDPDDTGEQPGQNGHSGPHGQTGTAGPSGSGQNGQPSQLGQKGQNGQGGPNGVTGQNGSVNGQGVNGQAMNALGESGSPVGDPEVDTAGFGTPVRVDEIALAAMALSENLQAATRGLPESIESRRFRRDLDDAAGTFRSVASELETTASNLIRLAAHEGQSCGVTWGICPDHGITLMNVGEVVTCHVLGCHQENEDVAEPCTQPVAYRVVDAAGPALLTCAGHAIACRLHLEGAVITLASDSLEVL